MYANNSLEIYPFVHYSLAFVYALNRATEKTKDGFTHLLLVVISFIYVPFAVLITLFMYFPQRQRIIKIKKELNKVIQSGNIEFDVLYEVEQSTNKIISFTYSLKRDSVRKGSLIKFPLRVAFWCFSKLTNHLQEIANTCQTQYTYSADEIFDSEEDYQEYLKYADTISKAFGSASKADYRTTFNIKNA